MSVGALLDAISPELIIAAFAGGMFGAALGALPAFIFTGFMVIAGESANLLGSKLAEMGLVEESASIGITGAVAFGPVFGPHVSFAGGVAAAAYASKKGYMDTGFDYQEAKNIAYALGTKPDVLAVGGAFGILGMLIRQVSFAFSMPWDPIAMGVVLSALFHRLILGYSIIGDAREGLMDMSPFENDERRMADGGEVAADNPTGRLLVEPWLPHQYKWANVATIGLAAGILGGYTAIKTGSPFLAFGISAASLVFLNAGVEQIPVTHHITLPASTIALAVTASGSAPLAGMGPATALVIAGAIGVLGALLGEVTQRIFYAHGDTHWDPPATSIVMTTLLIAILTMAGLLPTAVWVPIP